MKTVRKLNRAASYDLEGIQDWLEEMAAQGLRLAVWGSYWSKFTRGEPRKTRYRLSPAIRPFTQEVREDYRELGWEYVATTSESFFIFRAEDPSAPELFSDSASKAMAMEQTQQAVKKKLRYGWLILLFFGIALWGNLREGLPAKYIRDDLWMFEYYIWLILVPCDLYTMFQAGAFLRRFRALERGEPLPKRSGWGRSFHLGYALWSIFFCLLAVVILSRWFLPESKGDYGPVPTWVPQLVELEDRPDLEPDPFRPDYAYTIHPEEGSYGVFKTSLLAPVQYTIVQTGTDQTVFWDDLTADPPVVGQYDPTLVITLWETRWPALAGNLLEEELHPQTEGIPSFREPQAEELELDGYDRATLYRWSATDNQLFLLKGDRGMAVRWYSVQELEDHLEPFLDLLEADWT